jgi:uncharacterized protein
MVEAMSDQLVIPADASLEVSVDGARASRRQRWFELVLLLSIAFGQPIFASLHVLKNGQAALGNGRTSQWPLLLFHEITVLLLLGYILSRRKLRVADLGLRWAPKELISGIGLTIVSYGAYIVGYLIVHSIHRAIFGTVQAGVTAQAMFGHSSLFALPLVLVNPCFEELIVRAYLMTEVRELTGSAVLATVLSVAVQTSYHLYYGWQGALSLGFLFLAFAVYYSRNRRAMPIMLAHGVFDLLAFIRLW